MTNPRIQKNTGFTLVEMLVAVFVFSIIMTIAVGAIFSLVSANKSSQALKSVTDNLSSALDSMSREIRYGRNYHLGHSGTCADFTEPTSCPGNPNDTSTFAFLDRIGRLVIYDFVIDPASGDNTGYIRKCVGDTSDGNCFPLTASEVHIKDMHFYVRGAETSSDYQPQLVMTIYGFAKVGSSKSEFNIETMVTQRNPTCKDKVSQYLIMQDCS